VISLAKIPYIHRIYMVLANPNYVHAVQLMSGHHATCMHSCSSCAACMLTHIITAHGIHMHTQAQTHTYTHMLTRIATTRSAHTYVLCTHTHTYTHTHTFVLCTHSPARSTHYRPSPNPSHFTSLHFAAHTAPPHRFVPAWSCALHQNTRRLCARARWGACA